MLDIQIKNKNGVTLKTANKFISEDITVSIDENLIGINTTDATAEAADIVLNKTAYVKGEKITGNIEDWDETYLLEANLGTFPKGLKEIVVKNLVDVVDYATVKIVDENLKAENIAKDISILGITGTCRPYEEPKLQEKTVDQVGEVTPDEGYDGLSKVIVDMSGYEDLLKKLFDESKTCAYLFASTDIIDASNYISYTDTSNVTNMSSMFYSCKNLTTIPQLDTSNVTNMDSMFNNCINLTSIPQLDTSKVISMDYMFQNCSNLTSIPQLDTSKVTNMMNLFSSCSKLTAVPPLNTSKVTTLTQAFTACTALHTLPNLYLPQLTTASQAFAWCRSLLKIYLNAPLLTTAYNLFRGCDSLETVDWSRYNLESGDYKNGWTFKDCYSLKTIIIRSFGNNYLVHSGAFENCYHLTGTVNSQYNPNGDKDCYIYVPRDIVDTLRSTAGWSDHASQIRALEDYTVDGTTQGDLDPNKIN